MLNAHGMPNSILAQAAHYNCMCNHSKPHCRPGFVCSPGHHLLCCRLRSCLEVHTHAQAPHLLALVLDVSALNIDFPSFTHRPVENGGAVLGLHPALNLPRMEDGCYS